MSNKVMGTTPKFECGYICKAAKYLSALPKDPTWEDWENHDILMVFEGEYSNRVSWSLNPSTFP